jgi:hypothetical protein
MTRTPLVLAVLALASIAPAAFADEPVGPAFGNNSYAATIADTGGRADTDDYVASLAAGEKLTVRVTAPKGSSLVPALTLVAPDGTEIAPPAANVVSSNGGRSLALRGYAVPTTGRWAVRVAGAQGTQGAYVVTFAVTAARSLSVRHATVSGTTDVLQAFQGLDGARVDVKVVSRDAKALAAILGITDPNGAAVAGVTPVTSGRTASLHGLVLHGGDGTYRLRLGTSAANATYDLSVKVTPQGRPSSRRTVTLSSFDPYIDSVAAPVLGVAGMTIQIDGSGFDPSSPPTVLFGATPALATVAADGSSISAVVPAALDGSTVSLTVVGRDGQAATRDAYFHYVELPVVTDLVNDAAASVRAVAATGGMELVVRGAYLADGQKVFFGDTEAVVESVGGTTSIRVVMPAENAGTAVLSVLDAYGRTSVSQVAVQFMNAPTIDTVAALEGPYQVDATHVLIDGGAVIEIDGADFHDSDVVTVNGVVAQVVSSSDGKLQIIAPPSAAGDVTLVVSDAAGQSVSLDQAFTYVDLSQQPQ